MPRHALHAAAVQVTGPRVGAGAAGRGPGTWARVCFSSECTQPSKTLGTQLESGSMQQADGTTSSMQEPWKAKQQSSAAPHSSSSCTLSTSPAITAWCSGVVPNLQRTHTPHMRCIWRNMLAGAAADIERAALASRQPHQAE